MDRFNFSTKHLAINKANAQIVIAIAAASFIVVFCLVASKAVLSQYNYQAHVISKDKTAQTQLQNNITAYSSLVSSYQAFNSTNTNLLGSPVSGSFNNNTQIILDALPGAYDFPGLTSTLEHILTSNGLQIGSIGGVDQQAAQGTAGASSNPLPISMPFSIAITNANYSAVQNLVQYLQQSIRPMPIDSLAITADHGSIALNLTMHTYYQPAVKLNITKETVK